MQTLRACLEQVALLGDSYVVNESGYEWRARELLKWLTARYPVFLSQRAYLLLPDRYGNGAIYELSRDDQMICQVPLYTIEQHLSSPYPFQELSYKLL